MSEQKTKDFDCVANMRAIRDRISNEMDEIGIDAFMERIRSQKFDDPVLQKLADRFPNRSTAPARGVPA